MVFAWFLEWGKRSATWGDRLFKIAFSTISHNHERLEISSASWYATSICISTLLFDPLFVILGVLCLGIGDPIAGLVGRRWGRFHLMNRRTLEGSLAFWISASLACFLDLVYLHPTHPAPLALALSAGFGGMISELLSGRLDDNFTVPLGTAWAACLWTWLSL
jgi:dolichol kinase